MPSFSDSIFLFVLALLLFGPKKLPVLARELGKWVGEFRRASNEFKMQMEDELRQMEQADRQKKIAAMETAAPVAPALTTPEPGIAGPALGLSAESPLPSEGALPAAPAPPATDTSLASLPESLPATPAPPAPLPIASSGELRMMPPATGLPQARSGSVSALLNSIPEAESRAEPVEAGTHGD